MSTLNRQQPFGEIYGDDKGRKYEQNGKYFDAFGKLWVDTEKKAPKKADEPAVAPVETAPVEDQVAAQLKSA